VERNKWTWRERERSRDFRVRYEWSDKETGRGDKRVQDKYAKMFQSKMAEMASSGECLKCSKLCASLEYAKEADVAESRITGEMRGNRLYGKCAEFGKM
jgi:hypothetical protein